MGVKVIQEKKVKRELRVSILEISSKNKDCLREKNRKTWERECPMNSMSKILNMNFTSGVFIVFSGRK